MGDVISFSRKAHTFAEPPAPAPPSEPAQVGLIALACPCGSSDMTLAQGGRILCSECARECISAKWGWKEDPGSNTPGATQGSDGPDAPRIA